MTYQTMTRKEVLLALANETATEHDIELTWGTKVVWFTLEQSPEYLFGDGAEFRRKPKTIKVNGVDVPEPLKEMPAYGTQYFTPYLFDEDLYCALTSCNDVYDKRAFERGLMHLSRENAIAHSKAILGITA